MSQPTPSPTSTSFKLRPLTAPITGSTAMTLPTNLDLSHILSSVDETAFAWDFTTNTITWDPSALSVLGLTDLSEVATGTSFLLKIASETLVDRSAMLALQRKVGNAQLGFAYSIEFRFKPQGRTAPDTRIIEEQGRWWPTVDGQVAYSSGVMRVITARHAAVALARYRSDYDDLTGQFNRTRLLEELLKTTTQASTNLQPSAFLLASVNSLDVINETFGYEAGDEVLAATARLIKLHLRSGDSIGRFASNKFGIIINACGPATMQVVAERMMAAVRTTPMGNESTRLSASLAIGAVAIGTDAITPRDVCSRALQALDAAQKKRSDCFVGYEPNLGHERAKQRNSTLAREVMSALDDHRMSLVLQPLVCAKTRQAKHYECLLRMTKPDGQIVSAGAFMPIAEQLGLSRLIDLRAQELAIALLHRYPTINLAINVSGLTSGDDDWLVSLQQLTGGKRHLTERLTIEITETAAIQDLNQTIVFVDTIKDLGCRAAIDDFGVGYTNFRNLKLLNADLLKIDGTFVKNACNDKSDQVFLKSMVELATTFGMETVGEWVGDAQTADFLTQIGITYLQGFYFAMPSDPEVLLGPGIQPTTNP